MANDAVFRSSLIWLAVVIVGVGIYTQSLKKMMATYVFGMLALCGILLPDWDYFDRPISQWCSPITLNKSDSTTAPSTTRFKLYPIRLLIYTIIYIYGFYKWWMFISN
ncbi:signal peptidase complex-like protein DTM1 [Heracleum sosnowskyi]|uniref:Signal peptidase complex-like protein DTM1 n=1 Tax=Heracleum sosnowskyi TaxID=360622 RepID=A0AAD8JJL8_9APIA|nr:signal peptidase complex-like protein DTM1 [Heracleum sosnowskyi]